MSEIECDVSFCLGSNLVPFLATGWSSPEFGLTWSDGPESTMTVRPKVGGADYLIILQGRPYLRRPDVPVQRVEIYAAGKRLISFTADDETEFVSWFRIRSLPKRDAPINLTVRLPDHASPSDVGLQDQRRLGIALIRLRLIRLSYSCVKPRPYPLEQNLFPHCRANENASTLNKAVSELVSRLEFAGAKSLLIDHASATLEGSDPHSKPVRGILSHCLMLQEAFSLSQILVILFRWPGLSADFYDCPSHDPAVARVEFLGSGALRILFSRSISHLDLVTSEGTIGTIASYALGVIPLFIRYAASRRVAGSVNVTLADEAHVRGLAFSGRTPDTTLIPDPVYLSTNGYTRFREHTLASDVGWEQRRNAVFWRGSTTGTRRSNNIRNLDRVRLCVLARRPENRQFFDVGLSGLGQVTEEERHYFISQGLMKEYVYPEQMHEWKYAIDIDGNSNSWAGTFQKLLSGCLLLKITSREGWRQWYYDLLEPFENFVPIDFEMDDLVEKSKYFIYNDKLSRTIALAGRDLAFSLSFESQIEAVLDTIERGIIYDWVP